MDFMPKFDASDLHSVIGFLLFPSNTNNFGHNFIVSSILD